MKIEISDQKTLSALDVTISGEGFHFHFAGSPAELIQTVPAVEILPDPPMIAAPAAAKETRVAKAPVPAKKAAKKAAKQPPEGFGRDADDEKPRVTIRQRIIDMLKAGPKGSRQVVAELAKQGITMDTGNAGQHMYLMTRDKLAVRDDESNTWSLTA